MDHRITDHVGCNVLEGMIDFLHCFGNRLLGLGYYSPFLVRLPFPDCGEIDGSYRAWVAFGDDVLVPRSGTCEVCSSIRRGRDSAPRCPELARASDVCIYGEWESFPRRPGNVPPVAAQVSLARGVSSIAFQEAM